MEIKEDFTAVHFNTDVLKKNGVRGVVLHSMDGFYGGTVSWFRNPDSGGSAHFLISKDGEIRQMVSEDNMAWHAGRFDEPIPDFLRPNPNWYTIGIELEDEKKSNWEYPQIQRDAAAWCVAYLMKKYNLGKDRVFLHKDLNPSRRSDPQGNFSFDWLFNLSEEPKKDLHFKNGIVELNKYRLERERGPEGNYESFVRAIISSDKDLPKLLEDLENTRKLSSTSKRKLLDLINSNSTDKQNLELFWQNRVEIAKQTSLQNAPLEKIFETLIKRLTDRFVKEKPLALRGVLPSEVKEGGDNNG